MYQRARLIQSSWYISYEYSSSEALLAEFTKTAVPRLVDSVQQEEGAKPFAILISGVLRRPPAALAALHAVLERCLAVLQQLHSEIGQHPLASTTDPIPPKSCDMAVLNT
jgi:hypothetical protein